MMLMFGLVACSTTLLKEREQGTLRRLLVASAPRASIPLGKFLFTFAVGLLQLLVLFCYGELVFRVGTFRDPVTLVVLSGVWSACATAFGMLIATWAKSQKQVEGLSTLLILVMAALGGCWFPVQMVDLPWYAEVVTKATLTWWAMSGFQGMFWHQQSLSHPGMLAAIGVQVAFTAVAMWLSLRLFRRRFVGA
jgi:ABC-type multidrug transport system permease subunit